MSTYSQRVDQLDIRLFHQLLSQTGPGCRRSLLGVQSATARKNREYAYLEVGSHLGGTLRSHLVDERCRKVYSIDPRPQEAIPDDRSADYRARYEGNSTERMLELLRSTGVEDLQKLACLELDASRVATRDVSDPKAHIAFIDGEHTVKAVLSDFRACRRLLAPKSTVLFHDFFIIYPAIQQILADLEAEGIPFLGMKLQGEVYGLFFDPDLVHGDPYLGNLHRIHQKRGLDRLVARLDAGNLDRHRKLLQLELLPLGARLKRALRRYLPQPVLRWRRALSGKT